MKTPEELRNLANKKNKEISDCFEEIKLKTYEKHLKFLEESLESAAAQGDYEVMSENLYDTSYLSHCKYDPEVLEHYLREKLTAYFVKLGFSVSDRGANYLTISFKEKRK